MEATAVTSDRRGEATKASTGGRGVDGAATKEEKDKMKQAKDHRRRIFLFFTIANIFTKCIIEISHKM